MADCEFDPNFCKEPACESCGEHDRCHECGVCGIRGCTEHDLWSQAMWKLKINRGMFTEVERNENIMFLRNGGCQFPVLHQVIKDMGLFKKWDCIAMWSLSPDGMMFIDESMKKLVIWIFRRDIYE